MNSRDIRKKFIDFFTERGHVFVPSSPLIPAQDPTLLFTNAGMNQFKDVFIGKEARSYTRAVSIQKCMRAGGKHNDLENVGFTNRHLTFFEMLGNFSFGDYFKKDAIRFAWDFLTKTIGLAPEKLYASVYRFDDEAYTLWHTEIGLPEDRLVRLGEADNFWQMGETGPCGPCSEIYIDRGLQYGCGNNTCKPSCSCDRFLEIWNLVFMQFDRQPDGTDKPLKQTGVDTGMGFERLTAVIQNKDSVFETDLLMPLIIRIEKLTGIVYSNSDYETKAAFRVLSDHCRASCFAIADGCTPSNEGRGYVLRKIIRRAALFSQKLSDKNIFPNIAPALIDYMGDIYPELLLNQEHIKAILISETEKFEHNLVIGQALLNDYLKEQHHAQIITGAQAFTLYDTYGFPLELTKVIAQEHGFKVDTREFDKEMEKQRAQSGKKAKVTHCEIDESISTQFTGYDEHITQSKITTILVDNATVDSVKVGTICSIITAHSPFYVECGGQISDQGVIVIRNQQAKLLGLTKTGNAIAISIEAPIDLHVGEAVTLIVDAPSRINTMKNHTATHLLQAALIVLLGKQIKQAGSMVTPEYLRFDFTYLDSVTQEQIQLIEDLVNKKIMENIPVITEQTTLENALAQGVIAFFGEKYNPEKVRIVKVPGFSAELCGGTHVSATGDIGIFKITEISTLAAGIKRLVAVTGQGALQLFQQSFTVVKQLSQEFKVTQDQVMHAITKQNGQLQNTQRELKEVKKQLHKLKVPVWLEQTNTINTLPVLYLQLDSDATPDLKEIAQDLAKTQAGFYFVVAKNREQAAFFVLLSPQFIHKFSLQEFMQWLKNQKLHGGGSGNTLQGGAPVIPENFKEQLITWLKRHIAE